MRRYDGVYLTAARRTGDSVGAGVMRATRDRRPTLAANTRVHEGRRKHATRCAIHSTRMIIYDARTTLARARNSTNHWQKPCIHQDIRPGTRPGTRPVERIHLHVRACHTRQSILRCPRARLHSLRGWRDDQDITRPFRRQFDLDHCFGSCAADREPIVTDVNITIRDRFRMEINVIRRTYRINRCRSHRVHHTQQSIRNGTTAGAYAIVRKLLQHCLMHRLYRIVEENNSLVRGGNKSRNLWNSIRVFYPTRTRVCDVV